MEAVIKSIVPAMKGNEHDSFTGQYGILYKFIVTFDNNIKAIVNGKEKVSKYQEGDKINYTITKEANPEKGYLPQVKIEKENKWSGGSGTKSTNSVNWLEKKISIAKKTASSLAVQFAISKKQSENIILSKEDIWNLVKVFQNYLLSDVSSEIPIDKKLSALSRAVESMELGHASKSQEVIILANEWINNSDLS